MGKLSNLQTQTNESIRSCPARFSAPAMAGPYVESKHEFKGTDEDYSKDVHQARVGYETKVGALTPYIEGGVGVTYLLKRLLSLLWKLVAN